LISIAGGIATVATGGAAAPLLLGGLMWSGVGVGATGALLKVLGGIHGAKVGKVMEELKDAIKDDVEAYNMLTQKLRRLGNSIKTSEKLVFTVLKSSSGTAIIALDAYAKATGVIKMGSLLEQILKPLSKWCCSNPLLQDIMDKLITACCSTLVSVATEIATPLVESEASKIAAEAVAKIEDGFIKKQAHAAALRAAEELLKSGSDEALGAAAAATTAAASEAAKKAGGEVIKEGSSEAVKAAGNIAAEIAKQNSDEVARAAAVKAAEAAVENTTALCAKIAGGITIGLGVFFIIWDAYNLHADCNKKSLGNALREIAKELEETIATDLRD